MGQTGTETEDEARGASSLAEAQPAGPSRLCGRYTNGIDTKSRVVMPAAFRTSFAAEGGLLTPWGNICLAAMAPAEFDVYRTHVARRLADQDEPDIEGILRTLWSSTVDFKLDVQGRLVLPEEIRSQVGITNEVRFQGYGRRIELWPGLVTSHELDDRTDHLATLAVVQATYIPELES